MSVGSVSIRTRISDQSTFVDLRISHPMESGLRKDSAGVAIPAWYLTSMDLFHNDVAIGSLDLGPLVSRNPAISVMLNGGAVDDVVKVTWVDSRGETGEKSATLT